MKNVAGVSLLLFAVLFAGCASQDVVVSKPAVSGGAIVLRTVAVEGEEGKPFAAGRQAAAVLLEAMGGTPPKAVIMTECMEGAAMKKKALAGVASVLGKSVIAGGSTYGTYTQQGVLDIDAVSLLGIGGDGIGAAVALQKDMGAAGLSLETDEARLRQALSAGGASLARKLSETGKGRLMIVIADAHSPKNAFLVEGIQEVLGGAFPITGGSVNKNDGQTFVYYRGKMYTDSAVGIMLSGDFTVALAGRKAKTNEKVVATAREASAAALYKLKGKPTAMLAFDCAGRMGKLKNFDDELKAIQQSVGGGIPLYGCYCAGEIGPPDVSERAAGVLSAGRGWHIMVTLIGR